MYKVTKTTVDPTTMVITKEESYYSDKKKADAASKMKLGTWYLV